MWKQGGEHHQTGADLIHVLHARPALHIQVDNAPRSLANCVRARRNAALLRSTPATMVGQRATATQRGKGAVYRRRVTVSRSRGLGSSRGDRLRRTRPPNDPAPLPPTASTV